MCLELAARFPGFQSRPLSLKKSWCTVSALSGDFMTISLLNLRRSAVGINLSNPEARTQSAHLLAELFENLVYLHPPEVVLEIGAFEAAFSARVKQRKPEIKAFAFEANPHNFTHFSGRHGEESSGVNYMHLAISDHDGTETMHLQTFREGHDAPLIKGDDSLLPRTKSGVEYDVREVPSLTLDSWAQKNGFISSTMALWIDVEGAASKVLLGGIKTLDNVSALMIECEEHPHWHGQWMVRDVNQFMEMKGFTPIARDFEYGHQYNIVYIKEDDFVNPDFDLTLTKYYSALGQLK
ncbi:FkbM family methyltransferase [Methylorubrum thiocyanatum]|uniref:FkbM family methyltransferase n=1 Tax=Methylorubrum thiocyanatum TaxID=47958 RepID=UPI0036618CB2